MVGSCGMGAPAVAEQSVEGSGMGANGGRARGGRGRGREREEAVESRFRREGKTGIIGAGIQEMQEAAPREGEGVLELEWCGRAAAFSRRQNDDSLTGSEAEEGHVRAAAPWTGIDESLMGRAGARMTKSPAFRSWSTGQCLDGLC